MMAENEIDTLREEFLRPLIHFCYGFYPNLKMWYQERDENCQKIEYGCQIVYSFEAADFNLGIILTPVVKIVAHVGGEVSRNTIRVSNSRLSDTPNQFLIIL